MIGVIAMSVPTPEFGPAILAMPIWTMVLLHFWRAVGEGRSEYWIALAVGMGLLLLTTSFGWIFFILLAVFAAASVRGRAAFRSIDPWLCTFVAILVAAPYLAWLVHADDVWKPALARLSAIDLGAAVGEWLRIVWLLAVAHIGVVLLAALASPWRLPPGTRLPTVNRPPIQPLAKSMIYFFALAPPLVATGIVALLGQHWTLATAGPVVICSGLAAMVMAGNEIPLYRQRLLSMAWVSLLVGPAGRDGRCAVAASLDVRGRFQGALPRRGDGTVFRGYLRAPYRPAAEHRGGRSRNCGAHRTGSACAAEPADRCSSALALDQRCGCAGEGRGRRLAGDRHRRNAARRDQSKLSRSRGGSAARFRALDTGALAASARRLGRDPPTRLSDSSRLPLPSRGTASRSARCSRG